MPSTGSPLLDQYNQDGILTPGLQRAMDIFKQKNIQQVAPLSNTPAPQQGLAPLGGAPAARMPFSDQPAQPAAPTAPTPLSTAPSPHQAELTRLTAPPIQGGPLAHTQADTGRSGIEQVQNPWLRNTLRVLDAVGSGFAPRLTAAIPGTQYHHNLLVNQEKGNVNQEQAAATEEAKRGEIPGEEALRTAQTGEANANAAAKSNPKEPTSPFELWHQQNSGKPAEEFLKTEEGAKAHTAVNNAFQLWKEQNPNGTAEDYLKLEQGVKPAPRVPIEDQAVNEYKQAHPGATTEEALAHVKKATQPPDRNDHGQNFIDPKTNQLVRVGPGGNVPEGAVTAAGENTINTPTQTTRNASERSETMMDLDKRIRAALQNPEVLKGTGPLAGRLSEIQNRLGTLPHDLSELKNDLKSYGAFQAGLHPVRGIGGLEYFDRVMGGLGQTPEELTGKLDSNRATAESVERVAHKPNSSSGNVRKYNPATGKLE